MTPRRAPVRSRCSTVAALVAIACLSRPAPAQRGPARADTIPIRADYRDLGELLQKLPNVAAPTFDEARELWLGALPLACLDRLQPRPGGRGGGGGRANAITDSLGLRSALGSAVRDTVAVDSTGRAGRGAARGGGGANVGANNGAGYFWVATYRLVPDHDRLRAFWGCNDWHSAVGSTWVAVRLLRSLPKSSLDELAREKLNAHLGKSNLEGEIAFFHAAAAAINPIPSASQQGLFERPYGFAWLLKLESELRTWPDTQAQRWAANVAPLATWMADSLAAYIAKLVEPVRSGAQTNTAQSMTLALDYADVAGDVKLRRAVVSAARKFYLADSTCATQSERVVPAAAGRGGRGGGGRAAGRGGNADTATRSTAPNDLTALPAAGRGAAPVVPGAAGPEVLSPCLTEAALMSRGLEPRAYVAWLDRFLPPLHSGRFAPLTEPISIPVSAPPAAPRGGGAPDTSTAATATALATERARLAGLSFSRAQAMERIARALPPTDPRVAAWHRLSAIQADRGLELMRDDSAGISWLPAQALLYATVRKP